MKKNRLPAMGLTLALVLTACTAPGQAELTPTETADPMEGEGPIQVDWITDRWRIEMDNGKDEAEGRKSLRAVAPRIQEDLPGAEEINSQIEKYWSRTESLIQDYNDLDSQACYNIDYFVYRFGSVYEICLCFEVYFPLGGEQYEVERYCYDAEAGRLLSDETFLERLEYTFKDVEDAFYQQYLGMEDDGQYTYEYLQDIYYIGPEKKIVFITTM